MKNKNEKGFIHLLLVVFLLIILLLSGVFYLYEKKSKNDLLGTTTPTTVTFTKINPTTYRSADSAYLRTLVTKDNVAAYSILKSADMSKLTYVDNVVLPINGKLITLSKNSVYAGKHSKVRVWSTKPASPSLKSNRSYFAQKGKTIMGFVYSAGNDYSVYSLNDTEMLLIKEKPVPVKYKDVVINSSRQKSSLPTTRTSTTNYVDVLITFSKQTPFNSDQMLAFAELMVAFNNQVILNSTTSKASPPVQLRLVKVMLDNSDVGYGSVYYNLDMMIGIRDATRFKDTRRARELYGADIVVGVFEWDASDGSITGVAELYPPEDRAYALVINTSSLAYNATTFSHEIGHIFGMGHQRELMENPVFKTAYGYQILLNTGGCLSSIVAYEDAGPLGAPSKPCLTLDMYSTPQISVATIPFGNSENFNFLAMGLTATPISGFRAARAISGGGVCPTPGTKTCGVSCNSACDCDPNGNYACIDVGKGPVCWNESMCGGPAMAVRIQGVVRDCNNNVMPNVKVSAYGNTVTTDSLGIYKITKGATGQLQEASIMAGSDADRGTSTMFFTSDYGNLLNLDCNLVNCMFTQRVSNGFGILLPEDKLLDWGPYRGAYRIQKSTTMTDELFTKKFVSTTNYAGSFDFKRVDCEPSAKILDPGNVGVYRTVQKSSFDLRIIQVETKKFIANKPVSKVSVYAREFGSTENINNLGCTGTWFKVGDMYKNGPETNSVQPWYLTWDIRNDSRIVVGKKYLVTINAEAPDNKWCTGNPGKKFVGGTNLDYNTTCADTYFKTFCNPSRNPSATEGMWHILTVQ